MKLKYSEGYQCTIAAIAMLLDLSPKEVAEGIGHDGTKVLFPELPVPLCFSGVHIQEVIDFCISRGYALVPFEASPVGTTDNKNRYDIFSTEFEETRFRAMLKRFDGLLCGVWENSGIGHTVAWDRKSSQIYDPRGPLNYSLNSTYDFKISVFWASIKTPEAVVEAISNHLSKII